MRYTTRTIRCLLSAASVVGLAVGLAAGSAPAAGKDVKIAVVLPGPNTYFEPWRLAVADAGKKYGFEGVFAVPPTDAFNLTQENQQIDSMVAKGYNGFGLFPGDAHGTNAEEQKLADRGIVSINVNGCTYDPSPALFCVSTDVYAAAYYQAQQLIKAIGGEGPIALLTSQLTDPNTQLRIKAFKKAVDDTGGKVTLAQTIADIDTPESAPPAINALLAAQGKTLAGVMATSYYPSIAMASALTDHPEFRHIKVITAEQAPQVVNALEQGYIYGTLFQNTYGQPYVAAYALYRVIHDGCKIAEDAPFTQTEQTKKLLVANVLLITKEMFPQFKGKPEQVPEDTDRLMGLMDKVLKCP